MKPKKFEASKPILKKLSHFFSQSFWRGVSLVFVLVLLNILAFFMSFYSIVKEEYGKFAPRTMLDKVATNSDSLGLSSSLKEELLEANIWALTLDSKGKMLWSYQAPQEIPSQFSVGEVAQFSKGYLYDYPVFVRSLEGELLILGYPKESFFKLTTNYYPMQAIKQMPIFLFFMLSMDALTLFGFMNFSQKRMAKQLKPLVQGLESLAKGEELTISLSEPFLEVGESLNEASYLLSRQNQARSNWIMGISHDIRTPLSLIVGYSEQILEEASNPSIVQAAKRSQNQAFYIEQLVKDLNLVSKLEYDMQPLEIKPLFLAKVLRTCVADLLNGPLEEKHVLEIEICESCQGLMVKGEEKLIRRAILNLINNAIFHNPNGCHIKVGLVCDENQVSLFVQDDGVGLSKETLDALQNRSHYLENLDERMDLRHGLGLFLVKRIMESHRGSFSLQNNQDQKGAIATLTFPIDA